MELSEIYRSIEPWLYLIGSLMFLLLLTLAQQRQKTIVLKISFQVLLFSQVIAYFLWGFDYVYPLTPTASFVGSVLDLANPFLIFVVMWEFNKKRIRK